MFYKLPIAAAAACFCLGPVAADAKNSSPPFWIFMAQKESEKPFVEAIQKCQSQLSSASVLDGCREARQLHAKRRQDFAPREWKRVAAYVELMNSIHAQSLGLSVEAIKSADVGAKYLPDSSEIQNQRCWTRAAAGRQFAVAREACETAFKIGGATSALLNSLGLLSLKQGDWSDAQRHYFSAYNMSPSPENDGSLYGAIIATRALAAANPSMSEPILSTVDGNLPLVADVYKSVLEFRANGIDEQKIYSMAHVQQPSTPKGFRDY